MQVTDFERFFKENHSKAYYWALSLLHDEEAARDVVADSFEYLFTHYSGLGEDEARNNLFVIVRNRCADLFRKQAVHKRYSEYVAYASEKVECFNWLEHDEAVENMRHLMGELTPKTREILEAHYLKGMKYSEIADDFGISESAVKKHIMKALGFFRKKVKEGWILVPFMAMLAIL